MALPSPVADFPDMSGIISASHARARELVNSAWAGGPRSQVATPEQAAAAGPGGLEAAGLSGAIGSYGQSPFAQNPGNGQPTTAGQFPTSTRDLLAMTIQGEAGGEGHQGMLAVGSVIGNRARSGNYGGNTIDDVIRAPGQFSMWNGITGYAGGKGAIDPSKIKATEQAYQVADTILGGSYDDPSRGATHYYNPWVASPSWGQSAGKGEGWHTIGNHLFGWADGRPRA